MNKIELTESEVRWIKFCKGHYKEKYNTSNKNWIEAMKPMFTEKMGWSAEEFYDDFLDCMFQKLLHIYLKIQDDRSGSNAQLREIFESSFCKGRYEYERPIERTIAALCSHIQCNTVIEDGVERYSLDLEKFGKSDIWDTQKAGGK